MKLEKFYQLIKSNAFVTIATTQPRIKVKFEGLVRDIPEECNELIVKDFCVSDDGDVLFITK